VPAGHRGHFFGLRWQYTSPEEHVRIISDVYNRDGEALNNVLRTDPKLLEPGADLGAPMRRLIQRVAVDTAVQQADHIDVEQAVAQVTSTPTVADWLSKFPGFVA
jgi:hypothetical protein